MTRPINHSESFSREVIGASIGGIIAVVSALAITLIVFQYSSYHAAFAAQKWVLLGCMTIGGSALATFCISSAKKIRETNDPEILLGVKKEANTVIPLGSVFDEILQQYPIYQKALKSDSDLQDVVSYEYISSEDAYKALATAVDVLEKNRNNVPFNVLASVIVVVGSLLLKPHEAERLNDGAGLRDFAQEFFDIIVKTNDHEFIKLFLAPIDNKAVLERVLTSILSFGTEELALLFLEKIGKDQNLYGFTTKDFAPFFYLGWGNAVERLSKMTNFKNDANIIWHQFLRGNFIQKRLKEIENSPGQNQKEVHCFAQILKGNFGKIQDHLPLNESPSLLNFDTIQPLFISSFEKEIEAELARFNGKKTNELVFNIVDLPLENSLADLEEQLDFIQAGIDVMKLRESVEEMEARLEVLKLRNQLEIVQTELAAALS